jgi:hypothetical protein
MVSSSNLLLRRWQISLCVDVLKGQPVMLIKWENFGAFLSWLRRWEIFLTGDFLNKFYCILLWICGNWGICWLVLEKYFSFLCYLEIWNRTLPVGEHMSQKKVNTVKCKIKLIFKDQFQHKWAFQPAVVFVRKSYHGRGKRPALGPTPPHIQ